MQKTKNNLFLLFKSIIGLLSLNFIKLKLIYKILFLKIDDTKKKNYFNDIFIVTSCINHLDKDSISYNINHSANLRLIELLDTIKSIKYAFKKNYKIIICENSILDEVVKNKIYDEDVELFDISLLEITKLSRKVQNKGVPWSIGVLLSCIKLQSYSYRRLHFVTGRYKLNNEYDIKLFEQRKLNFRYYNQYHNVSTRYFCYTMPKIYNMFNLIKKVLFLCLLNQSSEDGMRVFSTNKKYITKNIGIEGLVNGSTYIKE